MPCNNCQGTMQNVGAVGERIFWCPRCGSLKKLYLGGFIRPDREDFETPNLVKLVRSCEEDEKPFSDYWPNICWAAGLGENRPWLKQ